MDFLKPVFFRARIGIACVIAGSLVSGTALAGSSPPTSLILELSKLADRPTPEGRILSALRRDFPDTFNGLARRAGELDMPTAERAADLGRQAMREFTAANRMNLAAAPDAALHDYVKAYAALMTITQRENPQLCARLAIGSRTPSGELTPAIADASATFAVATIRTARLAIDSPVARNLTAIDDADVTELANKLASFRLDPPILIMMDKGQLAQARPDQQCAAGAALINSIATLDTPSAARLTASILLAP